MKTKGNDIIMHNKVFVWVALATGLFLSIPYLAMRYKWPVIDPGNPVPETVNWTLFDFVVMGTLIFGSGSAFVLAARRVEKKHWLALGIAVVVAFLWIWAELAVGVFTNLGS